MLNGHLLQSNKVQCPSINECNSDPKKKEVRDHQQELLFYPKRPFNGKMVLLSFIYRLPQELDNFEY